MLEDTKSSDDWDDDGDSFEDDEEPVMVPCPYCREEMFEDSPRCPSCGMYVSEEETPPPSKPFWVLATIVICLIVALIWLIDI